MERKVAVSRRDALRGGVVVALVVVGCKGSRTLPTCTQTDGLSPEDIKVRQTLAYNDRCPDPQRVCERCSQYLDAPSAEVCGGCRVLRGPICPAGTCKIFASKV